MSDKPVTLRLDETDDTEQLAKSLLEQQRRTVGVNYPYCDCSAAVTPGGARRARKAGRAPRCAPCQRRWLILENQHRYDRSLARQPVPLCYACRAPVDNFRARYRARQGCRVTCGSRLCMSARKRATIGLNASGLLPCTICGAPSTRTSSNNARQRRHKPYCANHPRGRAAP